MSRTTSCKVIPEEYICQDENPQQSTLVKIKTCKIQQSVKFSKNLLKYKKTHV